MCVPVFVQTGTRRSTVRCLYSSLTECRYNIVFQTVVVLSFRRSPDLITILDESSAAGASFLLLHLPGSSYSYEPALVLNKSSANTRILNEPCHQSDGLSRASNVQKEQYRNHAGFSLSPHHEELGVLQFQTSTQNSDLLCSFQIFLKISALMQR